MRKLPMIGGDINALKKAEKERKEGWAIKRLQVIRLVMEHGKSADEIAGVVGISRKSVFNYMDMYIKGGIEGLLTRKWKGGPKKKMREDVVEKLREKVAKGEFIRAVEAQTWIAQQGCKLKMTTVYYWLKKVDGVLKMPRKTHVKKDAAKVELFKKTLMKRLLEITRGASKIRLWAADEHRFGLLPVIRKCWGKRGEKVYAPYQTKYDWDYAYEALELDGESKIEVAYMPTVCKENSLLFLKQISETDKDALHIVIWDGAGFHQVEEEEEMPKNVKLIPLPPYSPELNPVEELGDIYKDNLANKIYPSIEVMREKLTEVLRPFWENSKRVKQLVGDHFLALKANTCARY